VDDAAGGFEIEVRAVGGVVWRLTGNSRKHTVGAVKARLAAFDPRFSTHRADLVLGGAVLADLETLEKCGVSSKSKLVCVFTDLRAAVLIVGGGAAGYAAVECLSTKLPDQQIILVDAQEYSENASGILRAYADTSTWEDIVITHEDAISRFANARFVQGELVSLRPGSASIAAFRDNIKFTIRFNYCIIATGCSWASRGLSGESLWRPSCLSATRQGSRWPIYDERTVIGRRGHLKEAHLQLWNLSDRKGSVLVVGADYLGVEWACDLKYYFPGLRVTIVDPLRRCLAALPIDAAQYAERYMKEKGIATFYEVNYEPENSYFWQKVGMSKAADVTYDLRNVSARNGFMPASTVSEKGPGGGGWILTNANLQVCTREAGDRAGQVWSGGRVFAVGDCRYGAVVNPKLHKREKLQDVNEAFIIPPVPKTALAAIYWAEVACTNILAIMNGWRMEEAGWPVTAGVLAVSLGQDDGLVAWKVTWTRDSGEVVLTGRAAVEAKRRLSWPSDPDFLASPSKWWYAFRDQLPASRRLAAESSRGVLRLNGRS